MTELKTLKDIERIDIVGIGNNRHTNYNVGFVTTDELKQEAIKWVKERRKECENCQFYNVVCLEHEFWMERFNITEEDLK